MKTMVPLSRSVRRWWLALPCVSALMAGCAMTSGEYGNGPMADGGIDACATIPPGAIAAPAGTYLEDYCNLHAFKAEQDDFVIYKHEWCKGGVELGPYGKYHLNEISKRLPVAPFPVVIQVSGSPETDLTRRQLVVSRLLNAGIVDAEQRVILAFPSAEGLYGEEAEFIYEGMLFNNFYGNQSGYGFGRNFGYGSYGGGFFGRGGFGGFSGRGVIDDRRRF